jgi:hypothetical protein
MFQMFLVSSSSNKEYGGGLGIWGVRTRYTPNTWYKCDGMGTTFVPGLLERANTRDSCHTCG